MRGPLHLVTTEAHVEDRLALGWYARTRRRWLAPFASRHGARPAPAEVTSLATARAAAANLGEASALEPSPSLVRSLDDALGELRRAGISPADLRSADTARARLLAALLEQTDDAMARANCFDDRVGGWLAAEAIARAADDELPAAAIVEGLFDCDEANLAWIEALARRIPVTVRMPRMASVPPALAAIADEILSHLESRWQADSAAPDLELVPVEFPRELTLVEAANDAAEARAVASAVADALGRGTRAEAITIILPALEESFLELLRAAFDDAEIPFDEPRGRPPVAAPLPRAALAWLEFIAAPLERDRLVDLLCMPAVDPRVFFDEDRPSGRRQRALSLARELCRLPAQSDREGTLLIDLLRMALADRPGEVWKLDTLSRIVEAHRRARRPATRAALLADLLASWDGLGLLDAGTRVVADWVAAQPSSREARLLGQAALEQTQGMHALLEAVERVEHAAQVLGAEGERVTAGRLRGEVDSALAGVAPRVTRRPAMVRVVRAREAACLPSELLVITRASHGVFEPASHAHPLLDERVLERARGRPLSSRLRRAAYFAQLLAAMSTASRVVLSRSTTDADGRPTPAAEFFLDLAASRQIRHEPASPLARGTPTASARWNELIALHHGAPPTDPEIARRVLVETARQEFFVQPNKAPDDQTGAIRVDSPALRARLRLAFGGTEDRPLAATTIERAAQCRFAVFAARVLGASPSESASEELEPALRGSLVHRALKLALEMLREDKTRISNRGELVATILDKVKTALVPRPSSPLYRAEVTRALRDVVAVLEWTLDDVSGFDFAFAERAFGDRSAGLRSSRGAWPALVIGAGERRAFVRGRIDRIDLSRDGSRLRIVDYKSGALPAWKDVGRTLFQPPLYAAVARWQTGPLGLAEVRSLYLDTSKRPPRTLPSGQGQVITPAEMDAAESRASEIVALLWSGDVAPRPVDAAICSRCDVRSVCRRPAALPVEELDPEPEEQS
jgi:hypothetical protein